MSALSDEMENLKIVNNDSPDVTVEVRMKTGLTQKDGNELKDKLVKYLKEIGSIQNWSSIRIDCPELSTTFEYILVGSPRETNEKLIQVDDESNVIFYTAKNSEAYAQELMTDGDDEAGTVASLQWELPSKQFDPLWENLYYEDNVKGDLLSFINSLVQLSQLGVNTDVIDLNRLVLLHGPPGTGKTTLCKALAQRQSVRLQHIYKKSFFVEVNSHSLFSKWFSESGKFVQKLFEQITELATNQSWMIFVLIDEVESLVMERSNAQASDPSDSVRAVNAVLTQIDKIRRFPNVLVLTTSNITGALDQAFLDRTDISRFIGHPSSLAATKILYKGVCELSRIGVIDGECTEEQLNNLLDKKKAISGRYLKKLPIVAFSKLNAQKTTVEKFLRVLQKTIDMETKKDVLREIQNA